MGAATEMVRLDTLPKETVDKLLEIAEGGGSGGAVVVHASEDGVLDKTWQEINDAAPSVMLIEEQNGQLARNVQIHYLGRISEKGEMAPEGVENGYSVTFFNLESGDAYLYACSNADEYPKYLEDDEGGDESHPVA